MFDAIRNWFEVRAAMKDERRLRSSQALLNTILVEDRLKHVAEMLRIGQVAYATATMDEVLARYPDEVAELPLTVNVLINLKRLDDAEAVAVRGMQRNPDSRDFVRLYGDVADHRGDIPERLRRWRSFRRRYPAFGLSFRMEAYALLAAGEDDAAERVMAEGVRVVTDDVSLAIDYARRADARRDWPEALRRWTVVRDAFEHPMGASMIAQALVEQGLDDQAEAELLAARPRFPLEPKIVEDLAALAERRGNLDGALAYWAGLRRDLPHITRGYTEAARLLRLRGDQPAADAMIVEGAARAPDDRALQFEHAALAERDGNWAEAAQRWQRARQRFEADLEPYGREAAALRALGQLDQAEELLVAAHERFPDAVNIQQQSAELAEARGDLTRAVHRWRAVITAEPDLWWNRIRLARVLARSGDRAGADDALAEAIAHLPDEPALYAEYAVMAARDGRADAAAARWAVARQRFGLHPTVAGGEANWLREQGRLAEAKAILGAASQQAPDDAGLLHDLGHLAAQERDWPEAERCWRAILALQPQAGWAYGELARALREQGRAAEAESVLAEAWEHNPQDFGIGAAWARQASEAKDWPEARRRWALLGERFPAEGHPVWQEGIALREAGETEQAAVLFAAGAERFPADDSFPHDLARLAEARQDHAQAEHWWGRYQALQPDAWWGWLGLATAVHAQGRVDEAEELLLRGDEACKTVHAFLHVRAEWARHRRDWPEAERRAAMLAERFPDAWEGIWGQAIAVREQGRLDEARALLLRGAEQHPTMTLFAHDLARLAETRADWADAERWWRAFVALDDNVPWAHGGLADVLYRQGRAEDADRHLLDAIARHPDDIAFHQQYALAADHRGDLMLSRQRWRPVVERFPDDVTSLSYLAGAHAATNDVDEATRLLVAGLERFPDDRSIPRSLMTIAADRRDEAAAAKWRARLVELLRHALEQQPDDPGLLIEFVHAMAALPQGQWPIPAPQIERSLQTAIERGSTDGLLHAAYAGIAAGRADWPEQHRRLQASVERFPNDAFLRSKLFGAREIMLAAAEHGPSHDQRPAAPDGAHPDLPPSELVLYFESLGGGGAAEEGWGFGCEFGYFQREYGQEPLSLLRWASIGPRYLIRALNEDFAGFGNPEAIRLAEGGGDDWGVDDTVYQSRFDHTHLSRANVPRDEAQRLVAMRMKFLARKLVGDLQAGEKIFVYRVVDRELPQDTILRLAQSVNRFGRNILLFVALADDHHPAFQVRHVHPGLMIGYIDFFRASRGGFREWNHTGWLRLCREAVRVWRASAPETSDYPAIPNQPGDAHAGPSADGLMPHDFGTACAWARQAAEANDWAEARHRWSLLRDRFPNEGHPWWQEGVALRESGSPDKAHALFLAGLERFPADPSFAHDLARMAEARQDHAEAEHYWHRYLTLMPDAWWGWHGIATAVHAQGRIDEAEALLLRGHTACPDTALFLAMHAQWARDRQDWAEAERRAGLLMERFPNAWDGLWGTAVVAREQGRLAEAEALLLRGAEQHPAVAAFPHDLARLAEGRADWTAAARWWLVYLRLDPAAVWVWMWLARQLSEHGEIAEAETVLVAADAAHPSDPAYLLFHAKLAERKADWTEAGHRYDAIMARWPGLPDAIRGRARVLRQQGRHDAATEFLLAAVERHPEVAGAFACDLAQVAEGARDWQGAAHWWGVLLAADDAAAGWMHGARAHCLQVLGQHDVADAELLAAIARRPDAVELHHEYARAADRLGRRAESLRRWARAAERFPDDPVAVSMLGLGIAGTGAHAAATRLLAAATRRLPGNWTVERALHQVAAMREQPPPHRARPRLAPPPVRLNVSPGTEDTDAIAEVERITGMAIRDFIMQFDTLGESCEFGFIQRHCGAEPLGLMRFAGMVCADMARGISTEFAGLGERLMAHGDDGWDVTDLTYRMAYHTFRPKTEPEARLLAGEPRRLRFLARKLLSDIDEAGKIFVVWRAFIGMTPAVVQPLIDAVHARNPKATVVFVTPGAAVGSAERLGPYLFRGHVRALAHYTHQAGASVHHWLEMLVNVWLQMRDSPPSENEGEQNMMVRDQDDDADDAVLQAARAALPEQLDLGIAWAERATQAADWAEAQRRWAWVAARCPDEPEPQWQEANAARQAGDIAAARALLLAAAERHPGYANFSHDLARLAEADGNWAEAEQWWRRFVAVAPDAWWGQLGLASAILGQGRQQEADEMLAAAIEAWPSEPGLLKVRGEWARDRGDWPAAERHFARLAERFPAVPEGLLGQATAARQQGRIDEAERLLQQGAERHPHMAIFLHDLARLAEQRQDWPAAQQAWRRFLAIDPQPWWAHNALARVCLAQGARSDAVAILDAHYTGNEAADPHGLAEAIELLGASLEPAVLPLIARLERQLAPHVATAATAHVGHAYARAARFLENFDEYRTRAEALAARFPHEGFVREALHSACELAPRDEDLRAGSLNKALLGAADDRSGDGFQAADWLRFESLGGGGTRGGCEFGLLQRSVGEPLSLLRWASIEPEQLAEALERRFEGLGNPATLSIETQGHYDWKAVETVYNIRMDHTHLDRQTVSRETAARQVLTRLKFLSRKLINDLGEGDKIFAYRFAGGVPDEAMLQRLSRAMASYGASRLLIVAEDAALRDGIDYREPAPNVLLAVRPDTTSLHGLALDPRVPSWRQICEQGLLWQQGAFRPPAKLPYPGHGDGAEPLAEGADAISADFGIACLWANQATDAKDWAEARRRWALLRERFPAEGHPWVQEAIALRESGQTADARSLLMAGAARFPRDGSFAHDLARQAEQRDDWPEAEQWWRAFVGLRPDLWWAHTALAHALMRQDRLDDAEAVLLGAVDALPNEHVILLDYARLAERRRDWVEAHRRFRLLADRFPDVGHGLWGLAIAAREQGRLDEAEQLLRAGAERHPTMDGFAHGLAGLAEARGDWAEAERHWRAFLALSPHFWWAHTSLASTLRAQGRLAEAEAVLVAAQAALPNEAGILADYAQLAATGGEWAAALERWTTLRERCPDDPRGYVEAAVALRRLGRAEEADALLRTAAHRFADETVTPLDLAHSA